MTKQQTKTVSYGGVKLPVCSSTDSLIPESADSITLTSQDSNAIAMGILLNKGILLIGETGTGKTSIAKQLAYLTHRPYVRVNLTGFTTPDDLIGSKSVKAGATYYENGIISDAMQRGAMLVLDEVNATTPDCLFIIHGLMDDDKAITLPNGDVIHPHPDFRVIATCNPDYAGTRALNKAMLDRFGIIVTIDVLKPTAEAELLTDRTGIDPKEADQLVQVATMVRKSYAEGKILTYCSTRSLLTIGELVGQGMDIGRAYSASLASKAPSSDEKAILMDVYGAVMKMNVNDDAYIVTMTRGELKKQETELVKLRDQIDVVNRKEREMDDTMSNLRAEGEKHHSEYLKADLARIEALEQLKRLTDKLATLEYVENILKKAGEKC